MKKLAYLIILLFGFSCTNDTIKTNETSKLNQDSVSATIINFNPGSVYKSVNCDNNTTFSYALYLPKNYNDSSLFPVVYFFDSHGDGLLPVEKYRNIADEFNLIICCSNDSKNGLNANEINQISYQFIHDIKKRFRVNPKQQFTAGFSGGARVSVQIADINKEIIGVMGFGAGLPNSDFISHMDFNYFFAAGKKDFNFNELYNLNNDLNAKGSKHLFSTFDGKHEWPDTNTVKMGIYYMLLKSNSNPTESLLASYENFEEENLKAAKNKNDIVTQQEIYERKAITLDKVANTLNDKKMASTLKSTSQYTLYTQNLQKTLLKEAESKAVFSEQLANGSTEWWNSEIEKLMEGEKNAVNEEFRNGCSRLIGYLGLAAYIYANNALKNNQLDDLQRFLFIYEKLEPTNPEVYYLKAIFYVRQNNHNLALLSLEEAIKNGFTDFNRIRQETSFNFSDLEMDYLINTNRN